MSTIPEKAMAFNWRKGRLYLRKRLWFKHKRLRKYSWYFTNHYFIGNTLTITMRVNQIMRGPFTRLLLFWGSLLLAQATF